jgi:hypothetical protein
MNEELYNEQSESLTTDILDIILLFKAHHGLNQLQILDIFLTSIFQIFNETLKTLQNVDILSETKTLVPMSLSEQQKNLYSEILSAPALQLINDNTLDSIQIAFLYQSLSGYLVHQVVKKSFTKE